MVALVLGDDRAATRFLAALATGRPDRYPGFQTWEVAAFEVGSGGMVSVGLDGETMELEPPLRFTIRPGVLRIRLSKGAIGQSPAARAVAPDSSCPTCGASQSAHPTPSPMIARTAVRFVAATAGFESIDAAVVIDTFLLLLIGIGPKIALVPFLEVTAGMDDATKGRVARKMLVTAAIVAVLLVLLGEILTRLLHFSPGALSIAGGIVLFIIALSMILGPGDPETRHRSMAGKDPMLLAVFPLAVPYLLNPAGIVSLVTLSGDAGSVGLFGIVFGLLALVLALDVVVFRWANKVSEHLDESRMLVTEKVFGFLLAALGVQLALNGLSELGVIHLSGH